MVWLWGLKQFNRKMFWTNWQSNDQLLEKSLLRELLNEKHTLGVCEDCEVPLLVFFAPTQHKQTREAQERKCSGSSVELEIYVKICPREKTHNGISDQDYLRPIKRFSQTMTGRGGGKVPHKNQNRSQQFNHSNDLNSVWTPFIFTSMYSQSWTRQFQDRVPRAPGWEMSSWFRFCTKSKQNETFPKKIVLDIGHVKRRQFHEGGASHASQISLKIQELFSLPPTASINY